MVNIYTTDIAVLKRNWETVYEHVIYIQKDWFLALGT